jgi:hypothetical protein
MDPLTLFALANGAVSAVKAGCKLYKDIKGAAGDVKDVLKDLESQFDKAHPPDKPPTVAERNQYIQEKNRVLDLNKRDGETTNIYQEIGNHLGTYYDNYYKCLAVFEEEEFRAHTQVYTGDDSIGKRALQRVLMRKQLEAMSAELRELMVYQSPKELGALYTEVEELMKEMGKEQTVLIAQQMRNAAKAERIRLSRKKRLKYKIYCWAITGVAAFYIVWLVWAIVEIRMTERPELGRCLIPKGAPGYTWYNNLKWVNCEINI